MRGHVVFVRIGGFVACVARFLIASWTASVLGRVPLGTRLVTSN